MAINTKVTFQGGYFGTIEKSKYGQYFKSIGRKATLEEILESVEDDTVYFKLSCIYLGRKKTLYIERGQITEPKLAKSIADIGCDITSQHFNSFVDSLRLQEEEMDLNNLAPTPAYASLGWIQLADEDGNMSLYYRSGRLIGSQEHGKYIGKYYIDSLGSYEAWCSMVNKDVVPFPALQLVLVAALASVVIGILAIGTAIQNPVVHLNLPSGRGKSTAGYLAASIAGKPFDGSITLPDEDGKLVEYISIYQSWGATDNAMIATQAGNRGVVTVLNELGKSLSKNMTRLVFDLSEGSDKIRTNTKLESKVSKGYSTTFISTGESSILDKCNTKLEGLAIRVMEITKPLTQDAAHANRIQDVCFNNCGHAAPILAEHIIQKGGLDYVLPIYKKWGHDLRNRFPSTPGIDRFVEKFAALFMATAEIANEALDISLDSDSLLAFLEEYDREHGGERNTSAGSYDFIVEHCHTYSNKFVVQIDKTSPQYFKTAGTNIEKPKAECFGTITRMLRQHTDGRWIVEELVIRKSFLETLLKDNGYENLRTCIEEWKKLGVLDYEDEQHLRRSRTIDGSKERAYVFRVFATDEEATEIETELLKKEMQKRKKINKKPSSQLVKLLDNNEEDEVLHDA